MSFVNSKKANEFLGEALRALVRLPPQCEMKKIHKQRDKAAISECANRLLTKSASNWNFDAIAKPEIPIRNKSGE